MKRYTTALMILICLMMFTPVRAEITWKETEFNYNVNNLSIFNYSPIQYFEDYNDSVVKNEDSASYDSVAEIQISEYENIPQSGSGIQIQAKALGPESGTGPQNGSDPPYSLMVQALLSTVADGLNAQQGADIDLTALSRVVHRFEVNQEENYSVKLELSGLADFDSFYVNDQYRAFYALGTEITLEQIVGTGDQIEVQRMPGFPVVLDETNRTETVGLQLRSFDEQLRKITYRIKIELELKSRIDNFTLQGQVVAGEINGNYQVGSPQAPFILKALLKPGNSNIGSAVNLLLLSD